MTNDKKTIMTKKSEVVLKKKQEPVPPVPPVPPVSPVSPVPPDSFEAAMEEMETLVDRIEQADRTLDESLKIYERSTFLAQWCFEYLKEAEKRIQLLVPNDDGGLELADFEDDDK